MDTLENIRKMENCPDGISDDETDIMVPQIQVRFLVIVSPCGTSIRPLQKTTWHQQKRSARIRDRKHTYSNILKNFPPKNENFQIKISDIFHISAQNIDCGYSLEPPRRGGSNELPRIYVSEQK